MQHVFLSLWYIEPKIKILDDDGKLMHVLIPTPTHIYTMMMMLFVSNDN